MMDIAKLNTNSFVLIQELQIQNSSGKQSTCSLYENHEEVEVETGEIIIKLKGTSSNLADTNRSIVQQSSSASRPY